MNDPRITPGLRDELITATLQQQLERLDPGQLQTGPLDPAEAAGRLSANLEAVARRQLDGLEPSEQAAEVNRLAEYSIPATSLSYHPSFCLGSRAVPGPHLQLTSSLRGQR